jgi:hypothetical protein
MVMLGCGVPAWSSCLDNISSVSWLALSAVIDALDELSPSFLPSIIEICVSALSITFDLVCSVMFGLHLPCCVLLASFC